MDILFILLLIGSLVLSANNKKKKAAQQEAERKAAAARARTAEQPDAPAPAPQQRPAAAPPKEEPFSPWPTIASEGETAPAQAVLRTAPAHRSDAPPVSRSRETVQTTLREMPYQHRLESSIVTGHAHEESSITGIAADCPPERPGPGALGRQLRKDGQTAPATSAQPASGFAWDPNGVLQGIVMAEILNKPKCMRGHSR